MSGRLNKSILPFGIRLLALWIVLPAGISMARQSTGTTDPFDAHRAMSLTSTAFRLAVERIRPALVTIESFGGVSAVQGRIGGIRSQGEGNTTGILISDQGHIVTSTFNFIQSPPVITVITSDGKRRVAQLLGRDETRKICLLKIDPVDEIELPEIADAGLVTVGQWAISVGVGYGDVNPAISTGIISAKNRVGGRAIQTDANISPANYGGPLVDIQGRLIGVCVPMNPQSQAIGAGVEWYDSGIGFAIPLSESRQIIDRLKNGEDIYPAFLGVRTETNPDGDGIRIAEVLPDTPAAAADLKNADIILKINDTAVNDLMELKRILNRFEAGSRIKLEIKKVEIDEPEIKDVLLDRTPPAPDQAPQLEPPKIR